MWKMVRFRVGEVVIPTGSSAVDVRLSLLKRNVRQKIDPWEFFCEERE